MKPLDKMKFTAKTNDEIVAGLLRDNDALHKMIVYGFYEEERPIYAQGTGNANELCNPVTVEELEWKDKRITKLENAFKEINAHPYYDILQPEYFETGIKRLNKILDVAAEALKEEVIE